MDQEQYKKPTDPASDRFTPISKSFPLSRFQFLITVIAFSLGYLAYKYLSYNKFLITSIIIGIAWALLGFLKINRKK